MHSPRSSQGAGMRGRNKTVYTRDWVIIVLLGIFIAAIIGRLIYIQVFKAAEFSELAASSHTVDMTVTAKRGTIYDRNGEVLASSIDATTIYCDPTQVKYPSDVATVLTDVLGDSYDMTYQDYYNLVTKKGTSFV